MIILSQYVIVKTLLYVCSERSRAMVQDAYNISYQNAHQYSPKIVRIILVQWVTNYIENITGAFKKKIAGQYSCLHD